MTTEKDVLAICHKAGFKNATVETSGDDPRFKVTVQGKKTEFSSYFPADKITDELPTWLSGLNEDIN
ncbi:hypothetical protein V6R85_01430 [Agrobacterium sp. CCNWLW32]|uniref:hypothetical protein n=1 Tax=Agrobacterium sp. CCNWLW32 TaxID=3122072 RepID=UPI00300FB3E7